MINDKIKLFKIKIINDKTNHYYYSIFVQINGFSNYTLNYQWIITFKNVIMR